MGHIYWAGRNHAAENGPVMVCIQDVYLAGLLPEIYIYMSEHPHLCTDMLDKQSVEAGYTRKRRDR